MKAGDVPAEVVSRLTASQRNRDVANKIGTYTVGVPAGVHEIPFYVAAPLSTIDRDCPSGDHIPIELRDTREISEIKGNRLAPDVTMFQ